MKQILATLAFAFFTLASSSQECAETIINDDWQIEFCKYPGWKFTRDSFSTYISYRQSEVVFYATSDSSSHTPFQYWEKWMLSIIEEHADSHIVEISDTFLIDGRWAHHGQIKFYSEDSATKYLPTLIIFGQYDIFVFRNQCGFTIR